MEEEAQMPVDSDDLRLLDQKHPGKDKCPACGNDSWYVVQGPGMSLPVLPQGNTSGGLLMSNGNPLVTLACQRCGYVRSHIKALLDAYVKLLKEESHGDN